MSRGFFLGSIGSRMNFCNILTLMTENIIQKNLSSDTNKDFKKSNLDILTEENDRLLKNLKRPGGSYRAA